MENRIPDELSKGTPIVAIVAPAVAVNFKGQDLELNGWLKSIGVKAVFDVSFGAELTTKSYVEQLSNEKPLLMIAQPCPATNIGRTNLQEVTGLVKDQELQVNNSMDEQNAGNNLLLQSLAQMKDGTHAVEAAAKHLKDDTSLIIEQIANIHV